MQWYQMAQHGLNLFHDPAQVVFAFEQRKVVTEVLTGGVDVGFVEAGTLEDMAAAGEIRTADAKVALVPSLGPADVPVCPMACVSLCAAAPVLLVFDRVLVPPVCSCARGLSGTRTWGS